MSTAKHEGKVAAATLILVVYALGLSVINEAMSSVQSNKSITNVGTMKTVGVGVYWDAALTNQVSSINWGVLEPGSNKTVSVYIRNEGNSAVTLSLQTSNWNPTNASTHMTLSWDYNGQSINVGSSILVKLTLSVSASISGINNFSFDIVIIGTG